MRAGEYENPTGSCLTLLSPCRWNCHGSHFLGRARTCFQSHCMCRLVIRSFLAEGLRRNAPLIWTSMNNAQRTNHRLLCASQAWQGTHHQNHSAACRLSHADVRRQLNGRGGATSEAAQKLEICEPDWRPSIHEKSWGHPSVWHR